MKGQAGLALTLVLSMVAIGCSTSTPTVASKVSPSPVPVASQSAQPTNPSPHMVAIDWVRTQAIELPPGMRGGQSPDGSRFLSGGSVSTIGGDRIGDVLNRRIAWRWADDSRHLCAAYFDSPTPPADNSTRTPTGLYETLPGSAPVLIAQVGYLIGQSGPFMMGCSFRHGTATVGESCVMALCETWTVDLVSHRVLSHLTSFTLPGATSYPDGCVSPDGTLLAVSDFGSAVSTIYRTSDGKLLTTLVGSRVIAFTADDRAILVNHASGPAQLLDVGGGLIATLPGPEVQSALAEPGGSRLAVALGSPFATSTGYPGPADLVVVGVDGQVRVLAQGVLPQF